jgi:hypothetical protein
MRRIAALTAVLALSVSGSAQARKPAITPAYASAQASAYVAGVAGRLDAYTVRLSTDRFHTKLRFNYYLRWRDEQGRLCKFVSPPQVVVNVFSAVLRSYNFGPGNTECVNG